MFQKLAIRNTIIVPVLGTLLILGGVAGRPARAVEPAQAASYGEQAAYVLHLLVGARYDEAVGAAQQLQDQYPAAVESAQLRGVLFLLLGSPTPAEADLHTADSLSPNNPATLYGLALCALYRKQLPEAQSLLQQAERAVGSGDGDARAVIRRAEAYVLLLRGSTAAAAARLDADPGDRDAFTAELRAFLTVRSGKKDGVALLKELLATSSGIPRVREEDGIRALFTAGRPIEPAVLEPSRRKFYVARAMDRYRSRATTTRTARGVVNLTSRSGRGARPAFVSFFVDGRLAAIVNAAPYRYAWDTSEAPNGRHVVTIDGTDDSGRTLSTESFVVDVRNKNTARLAARRTDSEDPGIQHDIWKALRLRPSWKAAEAALGRDAAARGQSGSAAFHTTVAAALDPEFGHGRAFARALLRGGMPPLPPPIKKKQGLGWWQGPAAGRMVALTFDDGPNDKTTAMLDALDKAHASATFFVVGSRAELYPAVVARMKRRGDCVENHSYTHPNMAQSLPDVDEGEILRTSVVIHALTGRYPRFFRPPGGNDNKALAALARSYGMALAFWSIDGIGAEEAGSPSAVTNWVLAHVKPGSIVLLHNGADATIKAIPDIVAGLRARGFRIVTLEQMVRAK